MVGSDLLFISATLINNTRKENQFLFHYFGTGGIILFKQLFNKGMQKDMFISICDDNPLHLEHTLAQIKSLPVCKEATFQLFHDPTKLLESMKDGARTDILILDIEMPNMNGIELARQVNDISPVSQIVFLTGHVQYAQDVYSVEHVYMVLKNAKGPHLTKAMEKAIKQWERLTEHTMHVRAAGRTQIFLYHDVWYLERSGRRTSIHFKDRVIWTYQSPEELLIRAEQNTFFQCHKSYHVNIRAIMSWERICFNLRNQTSIPISRPYQQAAREWFFKGIQNRI